VCRGHRSHTVEFLTQHGQQFLQNFFYLIIVRSFDGTVGQFTNAVIKAVIRRSGIPVGVD
jgi:hypothetical protein